MTHGEHLERARKWLAGYDFTSNPTVKSLAAQFAEVEDRAKRCLGCVQDEESPHSTARHTCVDSARHDENFRNLVDAISAKDARIAQLEADLKRLRYHGESPNSSSWAEECHQQRERIAQLEAELSQFSSHPLYQAARAKVKP